MDHATWLGNWAKRLSKDANAQIAHLKKNLAKANPGEAKRIEGMIENIRKDHARNAKHWKVKLPPLND